MSRDPGTFTADCTRCGAQFLDDFEDTRCPRCRKLRPRLTVRDWLALAPEARPAVTCYGCHVEDIRATSYNMYFTDADGRRDWSPVTLDTELDTISGEATCDP